MLLCMKMLLLEFMNVVMYLKKGGVCSELVVIIGMLLFFVIVFVFWVIYVFVFGCVVVGYGFV